MKNCSILISIWRYNNNKIDQVICLLLLYIYIYISQKFDITNLDIYNWNVLYVHTQEQLF